jgi:hypothetical protein
MISSLLQWFFNSLIANPFVSFLMALVFGIVGPIYLFITSITLSDDKKTRSWPTVLGRIEFSSVKKIHSYDSGTALHSARGGNRIAYIPQIEYSYIVAGTTYKGEKVGKGAYFSGWRSSVQPLVKRFPEGTSVQVHYNPTDPKEAVLVTSSMNDIAGFIVAIFICLLSILFLGIWIYHFFVK